MFLLRPLLLNHGHNELARIDNHELLETVSDIVAVFDALPGGDAGLVHVEVEDADLAVEAAVARVAAEARGAGVAHPEGRLAVVGVRQRAVLVDVVAGGIC